MTEYFSSGSGTEAHIVPCQNTKSVVGLTVCRFTNGVKAGGAKHTLATMDYNALLKCFKLRSATHLDSN